MNYLIRKIFIISLLLVGSCSSEKKAPYRPQNGSTSGADASLTRPQVNVTQLSITSISSAKMSDDGILKIRTSVAGSGDLDYVKYKACPIGSSECAEGQSKTTQFIIPPVAESGKVILEVWPCVDSNRSLTGDSCGASKKDNYDQPKTKNYEVIRLSSLRQQKLNTLMNYGQRVKDIIVEFNKNIEKCKDDQEDYKKLMGIRQLSKTFIALGDAIITQAMAKKPTKALEKVASAATKTDNSSTTTDKVEDPDADTDSITLNPADHISEEVKEDPDADTDSITLNPADYISEEVANEEVKSSESLIKGGGEQINKEAAKPAIDQMAKDAESLKKFTTFTNSTTKIFSSVGLYDAKPVNAIQTIGGVILDLFTAKDAIKPNCHAEENTKREMSVVKNEIDRLKAEITNLDAEIKAAGGSI